MAQHCTSNSPAHFHLHFSRICTYAHALWRKGPWNWIRKHSFLSVSLTTVCKPPLLTPPVSSLCVFQSAARFCPGSISSTTSFQADYHNFFSTASPVYHFAILGKFGYFFAIIALCPWTCSLMTWSSFVDDIITRRNRHANFFSIMLLMDNVIVVLVVCTFPFLLPTTTGLIIRCHNALFALFM